ncbi:hypothetical protein GCM10027174_02090 [Salinifilum aidingensis]
MTNAVFAPGRSEICVICPSTQTAPSRWIHSATLRATVRTGHGWSALVAELSAAPGVVGACGFVGVLVGAG